MPLKKKIKKYLLTNNINSFEQLIYHIEELKTNKDLSIDERDMLFKLVFCVCNKKDSLLTFFGENKISKDVFDDLDNLIKSSNKESIKEGFWNMNMTNTDVVFGKDTCITNFFTDWKNLEGWETQEQLSNEAIYELAKKLDEKWVTKEDFESSKPILESKEYMDAQARASNPLKYVIDDNPISLEDKIKNFRIVELESKNFGKKESQTKEKAYKETEGKLYYEISWEFIEEIAKRMASNKGDKYNLYNWKLPMTPKGIDDLKQAINRHHVEVMKGNYRDGDEVLGHIVAYANNAMMLWEQLREKDENK